MLTNENSEIASSFTKIKPAKEKLTLVKSILIIFTVNSTNPQPCELLRVNLM